MEDYNENEIHLNDGWEDEEVTDTPDEDFDNIGVEDEVGEEELTEETVETEETEEETEPNDVEETDETDENTNESDEPEETMMLKYNHEEKDYTLSEVKGLAQKGMNYDKVVEKLNTLEESPSIQFVEQQARANDMSVKEYIQATHDYQKQLEVDKLVEAGNTEDVAKELIDKRYAEKQAKLDKEDADKEQLGRDTEQKDLDEFLETFPDVKADEIPSEVFKLAEDKNLSLTDAMFRIENQRMAKEMKTMKRKASNKKKAPLTKGVTDHGADKVAKVDPDLDGWDDTDY